MQTGAQTFFRARGREGFSNGELTIWRCPTCAWWREWTELRCCGCGTLRDGTAVSDRRSSLKNAGPRRRRETV
jgi:hypothetical protein